MKRHIKRNAFMAFLLIALGALAMAAGAQAKLVGEFTKFANCDYHNPEVNKCIYSATESGTVILGSKEVPIVNPVILQGGYAFPGEDEVSKFIGATNGITLSKASQPVPGGLAGFVNCKKIENGFLRASCEFVFENGLTGVSSTLELARSPSEIRISENHLASGKGVALEMPVRVHLENPLFGSGCYVGSSGSPIIWKLTSGTTSPPAPNEPISGKPGKGSFLEKLRIFHLAENTLVDNAWSAPGASGCGGFLVELLLDPIVNLSAGLPAEAGHNTAILNNDILQAAAVAIKKVDETNP